MKNRDKRIDTYIDRSEPFARPILNYLRALIHEANPEIMETIKWGMPFFEYKGPTCNMAAFKQHVTFGFWKYSLIKDPDSHLGKRSSQGGEAMGNLGRITSLKDLPPKRILLDFIRQAKKLNDAGIKMSARSIKSNTELIIPDYLIKALNKNKNAQQHFESFSRSCKREYIDWITSAKTDSTREKRMNSALESISEGKKRNWKYEKK